MNMPYDKYVDIHKSMPIVCVDCVISHENKILLIQRTREPMKDSWWFPGGRLLRNEKLAKAAFRIVKSETGIDIARPLLIGHGETEFEADPFGHGLGTHTVNFVYASSISHMSMMKVVLDENHIDHKLFTFDEIYKSDMHPYVKRFAAIAEGISSQ